MPTVAKTLSAIEIARLNKPGAHAVGTVPGLLLQIAASGARSWILRVRVGAARREIGLGGYPAVSAAEAWKSARAMRAKILAGADPVVERRTARLLLVEATASALARPTFDKVTALYLAAKGSEFRNAKHLAQWSATLATYASPIIGAMPAETIETKHVLEVLTPIWLTKTETASRLRGRIEAVLSYAMQAGHSPAGLNPARWRGGLDKLLAAPAKVAGARHFPALPYREMSRFVQKLRENPAVSARCLEFTILTACRSGEARGAQWSELDATASMWTIPGARMKAGRIHAVPLTDAVQQLLLALPRFAANLFPGHRAPALSDATLGALIQRMHDDDIARGGPGFVDPREDNRVVTAHGFRSAFADWARDTRNDDVETREAALAHAIKGKTQGAYLRGEMLEKRIALMSAWAAHCGY